MSVPFCPACGHDTPDELVDLGDVPTLIGALWDDPEQARAVPRGRMDLVCCPICGHAWNRAFEPALIDYDADYEASLHFSPLFQSYADDLADRLVEVYGLRGKHVLEIGSGKGEFLTQLCVRGGNTGTGYDPTYTGRSDHPAVEFRREYFPLGERPEQAFDLLACRHVLEHLDEPAAFLRGLADSARALPGAPVFYFEVPNAAFNFGAAGLWDCIYPHVSYFSLQSLRRLVQNAGFRVLRLGEAFHGQFLAVEAVVAEPLELVEPVDPAEHLALLNGFAGRYRAAVGRWGNRLREDRQAGARIAMWGAGSKAMVFLNAVAETEAVHSIVDLNPAKWGRYLPGTGHLVHAPHDLVASGAQRVLVTNPAYVTEISESLEGLGLTAEVVLI